jgi:hypothetical protein
MTVLQLDTGNALYHKFIGVTTGADNTIYFNIRSYRTLDDLQRSFNEAGDSSVKCSGEWDSRYALADVGIAVILCADEWADAEVIEC